MDVSLLLPMNGVLECEFAYGPALGQMEYVLTHHMNVAVSEIAEDGPRGEVVYTTTKRTDELLFHPDVVDRATAYIAVGKWDPRV
jgi:hypothetical protein